MSGNSIQGVASTFLQRSFGVSTASNFSVVIATKFAAVTAAFPTPFEVQSGAASFWTMFQDPVASGDDIEVEYKTPGPTNNDVSLGSNASLVGHWLHLCFTWNGTTRAQSIYALLEGFNAGSPSFLITPSRAAGPTAFLPSGTTGLNVFGDTFGDDFLAGRIGHFIVTPLELTQAQAIAQFQQRAPTATITGGGSYTYLGCTDAANAGTDLGTTASNFTKIGAGTFTDSSDQPSEWVAIPFLQNDLTTRLKIPNAQVLRREQALPPLATIAPSTPFFSQASRVIAQAAPALMLSSTPSLQNVVPPPPAEQRMRAMSSVLPTRMPAPAEPILAQPVQSGLIFEAPTSSETTTIQSRRVDGELSFLGPVGAPTLPPFPLANGMQAREQGRAQSKMGAEPIPPTTPVTIALPGTPPDRRITAREIPDFMPGAQPPAFSAATAPQLPPQDERRQVARAAFTDLPANPEPVAAFAPMLPPPDLRPLRLDEPAECRAAPAQVPPLAPILVLPVPPEEPRHLQASSTPQARTRDLEPAAYAQLASNPPFDELRRPPAPLAQLLRLREAEPVLTTPVGSPPNELLMPRQAPSTWRLRAEPSPVLPAQAVAPAPPPDPGGRPITYPTAPTYRREVPPALPSAAPALFVPPEGATWRRSAESPRQAPATPFAPYDAPAPPLVPAQERRVWASERYALARPELGPPAQPADPPFFELNRVRVAAGVDWHMPGIDASPLLAPASFVPFELALRRAVFVPSPASRQDGPVLPSTPASLPPYEPPRIVLRGESQLVRFAPPTHLPPKALTIERVVFEQPGRVYREIWSRSRHVDTLVFPTVVEGALITYASGEGDDPGLSLMAVVTASGEEP